MTYRAICLQGRLLGSALFLTVSSPLGAMAEPVTLAVIGDSWSSGYGLAPHEGFVEQLDIWLQEHSASPVVMKDYAVSGLTTAAALALLEQELDSSVDAMIVQLGGNDNSIIIEGGETRANLRKIVELAQQEEIAVLLVGAYATVHQTRAYRLEFDTLFAQVAAETGSVFYPSFYHVFGGRLGDVPPEYLLWDRDHPTAEAVRLIVDDIGPTVLEFIERTSAANDGN